ncbi:hypothetical protein IU433_11340 [Nocardia puris]|nr:hypothetical protein [Nocardia puris]MBF6214282.1 hypothetical protein [Nocardia puris]MBF6365228.1 hypothetical protein [Nocardia puris]MBF6459630.1 hypothetical protein [Nocardia puris]
MVKRALAISVSVLWLVACGGPTPDSPSEGSGSHLACATGQHADSMFTSEPGAEDFTLQAPRLPGWTQRQSEGPSPGFVLHRFDPPTADADMGTATVTLTAFSPTDTAAAALDTLRTLRANGPGWQESSSEPVEICDHGGVKVSGIYRTAGLEVRHEYLEFPYGSTGSVYPIQVSSGRATTATLWC